jgi:hypothetical protein
MNAANISAVSTTCAVVARVASKVLIAHIQDKLINSRLRHFFAVTRIRRDLAGMHETIGEEHGSKNISWVAQMKNNLGAFQGAALNKEPEWPKAAVTGRDEILTVEDSMEW